MEKKLLALLCSALLSASTLSVAEACTRITYATTDNVVVTGRNMDWDKDDALKLHIMPRNAQRSSEGKHPFSWTAKYGSVIAWSFNGRVANSGMNEKGLQADLLYLGEANYGEPSGTARTLEAKKLIQYVLDNFATVSETESALKDETLHMVSTQPNAGLHFMVTDKSGANIIIEIFNGKLKLYPKTGNAVMTNDPNYEAMSKIYDYYREKDLSRNMPGSPHSVDRFMRATGWLEQLSSEKVKDFINLVPDEDFAMQTRMSVLSVMRNVSTPFAISTARNPENSTTVWRGVSDLKNHIMMFDLAASPSTVWVDLGKINFEEGERVLSLSDGRIKHGDITEQFLPVATR